MTDFKAKYLMYKAKYLHLKNNPPKTFQSGGGSEEKAKVLLFKATWCGHCTRFEPIWKSVSSKYSNKYDFQVYDVDEPEHKEYFKQYNIKGYPTIKFEHKGDVIEYKGERTADAFEDIIMNLTD